jgi:hypothetical protein
MVQTEVGKNPIRPVPNTTIERYIPIKPTIVPVPVETAADLREKEAILLVNIQTTQLEFQAQQLQQIQQLQQLQYMRDLERMNPKQPNQPDLSHSNPSSITSIASNRNQYPGR